MPRRRPAPAPVTVPLGSLTQPTARAGAGSCGGCGSHRVTELQMCLTDGSPVTFVSCHACEHRTWTREGAPISVAGVLARSRKG